MNSKTGAGQVRTASIAQLKESQYDFVHDSQQAFKSMMMALAFPGTARQLVGKPLSFPDPDLAFVLQPMLTLLDLETCFHVLCPDTGLQKDITRYIEINTHSQSQPYPQADFVVCVHTVLGYGFGRLKKGSLAQPDQSATVFYLVDRIAERPDSDAIELHLSGPGIKDVQTVCISGLPPAEVLQWQQNRNDYPMGIDIFIISRSGAVAGIPRSVNIQASGS